MNQKKKEHPKIKTSLHPRNKHRERYDFKQLIVACPELAGFVKMNIYGDESVDFFNPEAVRMLNKALLMHYYGVESWDIPADYLCPPVPGRADYIHHVADLLAESISDISKGEIPKGDDIKCLDIGVGANCIYPIIGNKEYGWSFTGSDIDPVAIESAKNIIELNSSLKDKIKIRLQTDQEKIFRGIIENDEYYDLVVCNPPFHASLKEAREGSLRKLGNLKKGKITNPVLNFGGKNNELWCDGGEARFIEDMIFESSRYAMKCMWFTTLISKQSHVKNAYSLLRKVEAIKVKTIPMGQGNKSSRIVAWTFLSREKQSEWITNSWENSFK